MKLFPVLTLWPPFGAAAAAAPPGPGPPPAAAPAGRDDDVYRDAAARLRASGAFDQVHYPSPPDLQGFAASALAAAVVVPGDGTEDSQWDSGAEPVSVLREVSWTLLILARAADPVGRARAFDRLANAAANALNGKSLAGITLPALTRVRRTRAGRAVAPEQGTTLAGTFSYFVDGWGRADESE